MGDCDEFDLPFPKLGEMMQKTGADPVVVLQCEAQALAAAIQQCHACMFDTSCREWLNQTAAGSAQRPPAFCPNAALLVRLRGMQPPADIGSWL
jgi:hypothetical protein